MSVIGTVIATLPVGTSPAGVTVSRDGTTICVTSSGIDTVFVYAV